MVSAAADKNTGLMKNVAISNPKSPSQAYSESDIGIYFAPTFARGVVTVSVNPSIEYSWWINVRTDSDVAASQGAIGLSVGFYSASELRLSQRKAPPQFFDIWGEILMGQLDFGFGSIPGYPLQLSIPVTDEYVYLFSVGTDADGWPKSLAGGNLAVTVPSFTVYAQPIPQTPLNDREEIFRRCYVYLSELDRKGEMRLHQSQQLLHKFEGPSFGTLSN